MRADFLRRCGPAAILLSLGLGLPPAFAQSTTADRPWTDPPAKTVPSSKTAPSSPPSQAATTQSAPSKQAVSVDRQAARTRVAAKPRQPRLAESRVETGRRRMVAERPRLAQPLAVRPSATRPVPARMTRRPVYAQRLPVGRFEGFEMDERSRRIREAEEAGFLVVRSRTVEFPDGRRMRTYTPYEEPDDFDD